MYQQPIQSVYAQPTNDIEPPKKKTGLIIGIVAAALAVVLAVVLCIVFLGGDSKKPTNDENKDDDVTSVESEEENNDDNKDSELETTTTVAEKESVGYYDLYESKGIDAPLYLFDDLESDFYVAEVDPGSYDIGGYKLNGDFALVDVALGYDDDGAIHEMVVYQYIDLTETEFAMISSKSEEEIAQLLFGSTDVYIEYITTDISVADGVLKMETVCTNLDEPEIYEVIYEMFGIFESQPDFVIDDIEPELLKEGFSKRDK